MKRFLISFFISISISGIILFLLKYLSFYPLDPIIIPDDPNRGGSFFSNGLLIGILLLFGGLLSANLFSNKSKNAKSGIPVSLGLLLACIINIALSYLSIYKIIP